ncbi:hypothetical protein MasN3_14200 [Massilia varians]|uniref:Uncharacterized protein n=1 Tax=Massilia varians TaxID=457921 RepID=A0ABM8C3Z8_9BURK|nr:hypothetical protein [Massilia varians]BDT57926.1 hypothetical protein MasN3_14200 [Massilia varians]
MLSLHTNNASLAAQNSLTRTQSSLSTSMTHLSVQVLTLPVFRAVAELALVLPRLDAAETQAREV